MENCDDVIMELWHELAQTVGIKLLLCELFDFL